MPAPTHAVDLALTQDGIIRGRVLDPNGRAVLGITVVAYRVSYNNGSKVWFSAGSKATDDRGEYRISWVPPGEYYVGDTPRNPGAVPEPQDNWARTFFPNATGPEAASVVVINRGTEAAAIDINMRAATRELFTISGVVNNPYAGLNAVGAVDKSVSSFFLLSRPGLRDLSVQHLRIRTSSPCIPPSNEGILRSDS